MPFSPPSGDKVLTPAAAGAYRVFLFVAGWFLAGVAATVAALALIGSHAAQAGTQGVDLKLETILHDVEQLQKDMAVVKCRLNLEGTCPP